jgi:hypothetical protein
MASGSARKGPVWLGLIAIVAIVIALSIPAVRGVLQHSLSSLRMQKVQAVNLNLSPFMDSDTNPSLHQMVSQMISDKVQVVENENDQPAPNAGAASKLAGFHAGLLSARSDAPKIIVGGVHKVDVTVDLTRLRAIANEAGHQDLSLPQSLDGSKLTVQVPRSVNAQYGTCPGPTTATDAVASNIAGPTPTTTQFSDCVRLREGPSTLVNVPPGLDLANLAEIGLETGGMSPAQARDFLQTVDWRATLTMSVPRLLRSYQQVDVDGTKGTLLVMAGRRGPGYTLIWAKDGISYNLTGFGDSSEAVALGNSIK